MLLGKISIDHFTARILSLPPPPTPTTTNKKWQLLINDHLMDDKFD